MFIPVILFFIAFITTVLIADNFMLARWIFGTYIVPTFYPTVINCNTSDNPLAVVHTLNTLQKRRDIVVLLLFSAQILLLCCLSGYPWADQVIMLTMGLWIFYKKPQVAILMECEPYSGKTCTFEEFVSKKEEVMSDDISKELSGFISAAPAKENIIQALHISHFDKEKAVALLKEKTPLVSDDSNQDYLIEEYQTSTYTPTEYDIKTSETQQNLYRDRFYQLVGHYGVNLKHVSFVTGNASLLKNYCGVCRVPARPVPEDDEFMQRDLETYESWFDTYCANKSYMTVFSYGSLSTVAYGVTASPNTKVCLFSQSSCWEANNFYPRSRNAMANPTAANSIINHAWITVQIPDDYVLRTEEQIVSYMGSSPTEAVETVEYFHGSIDKDTIEFLNTTADRGAFPLYDCTEETIVMPNFVTAAILLHPWSVLYQMVIKKRSFDFIFLPFYSTIVTEDEVAEKTWRDGNIFTLVYDKYSFRALDAVVTRQTFSTEVLPKKRVVEETVESDSADDADSEAESFDDEEEVSSGTDKDEAVNAE